MAETNYDPRQRHILQQAMKHFQREMLAERKGTNEYKVRQRFRTLADGNRQWLFDVVMVDPTRRGDDPNLGDPIVVAGPFLTPMEADAAAREHKRGKRVFAVHGSRVKMELRAPRTEAQREQALPQAGGVSRLVQLWNK